MSQSDADKLGSLPREQQDVVTAVRYPHKKAAFLQVAALPGFMLLCYLGLFFYFRAKGGYQPVEMASEDAELESEPGF